MQQHPGASLWFHSVARRIESPRAGTRCCAQYLIHQMSTASLARLGQMAPCPLQKIEVLHLFRWYTHTDTHRHTQTHWPRWCKVACWGWHQVNSNSCRVTWNFVRVCFWHGPLCLATTNWLSIMYSILWCTCQNLVIKTSKLLT